MDGFSGYNQISICCVDQLKTAFISVWGNFAYRVMPFGLKNVRDTFQQAMSYCFHDLAQLILSYLDNLTTCSRSRAQHIHDLRTIFLQCSKYKIQLNPLKCVFCVLAHCLLGFIVSKDSIILDPLKVQAILELPPPCTLRQLQGLQGNANFLHIFVPDYATTTHGFLGILCSTIPFFWNDHAQQSFDALKLDLTSAPLISPPDFTKDFILYILASAHSVVGVLI